MHLTSSVHAWHSHLQRAAPKAWQLLQVPSLPEEAVAGEEPAEGTPAGAHRCCACCACANVAHGAFCLFSVVAFFGILVGAPVYLYLVKLPKLACAAAV